MNIEPRDALAEANDLYDDYSKLSELGNLGIDPDEKCESAIIASVSPVLIEGFANAIVE